jgi:glycosyltransferase involved in cell wall biosynthesis
MNQIKEITVFTTGDSGKLSTWSNVLYFFTETLISKGIAVNRVDLSPSLIISKLYSVLFFSLLKLFFKKTTYTYFRTLTHYLDVRHRIKKAVKKFPNADLNVFMTFSFSAVGFSDKPSVQICDWTYDHYFNYFENRKPDFLERASIKRENKMIEGSDFVFPLFPGVADYMKTQYKHKNIFYVGHVINSAYEGSEIEAVEAKMQASNLLFVGDTKYLEGAVYLIKAFKLLKEKYPDLTIHIIGMNEEDIYILPEGVRCYGYLDKGIDRDREIYYSLFQNAKIFINTTDKWGAFSATIEAMYFYTPVIVTPYNEFVRTFGEEIEFGYYCKSKSAKMLQNRIAAILENPAYDSLCHNAHNAVKTFTWTSFVDRFLEVVSKNLQA